MLRATFIALSQSKSLRSFAEKTAIGQRLSSRFVAGTTIEEALRATQAMNQLGLGVSVDNLGENVTNAEEAQHSAELYHQLLELVMQILLKDIEELFQDLFLEVLESQQSYGKTFYYLATLCLLWGAQT